MRTLGISTLIVIGLTSGAVAQGVTGQTCVDLATTVGQGLTYSLSQKQLDAMRHYANCRASSSQAGGGLDITYGGFGLGGKYSEARAKAECTQDDQQLGFSSLDIQVAKRVFDQGLATVNLCLEKASKSWSISAKAISNDSISVSVANLSPSGADILGIDILPENSLKCLGAPTTFPLRLTAQTTISMTCYRDVKTQTIENVIVSSTADATLNLRLADGPFPISLKGYSASPFDDIKKELTALRAKLSAVENSIYGGSDALGPRSEGGTCPPGEAVARVTVAGKSGGSSGYVGWVYQECRPLKFPRPPATN
ncbi:hypothetical protein [Bradyrhizobium liaoningense]|uniref:hypothetical protein n=1 Tax=Bradyrhizobium liaoningense TaxID=43992 RepID=UPI001BAB119E|nr:hypothetical protein [Bradyrhizobium liaoningense]MBR1065733.1 hypothetical protein [Bradyrhizobium liaoningense]